jgi:hypothetical protein
MSLSFICGQVMKKFGFKRVSNPSKDETHDLTVHTLRALFSNWVERMKWIALNDGYYYR